ncbi:MAG: DNA repair protein RecO [Clostridia bacterium]|nr:DNA repair protein RecO [Clostridia bacterium]
MKLTKIKGIVIKETSYKDNDKIITILSDELGKVSVIAKGAKKTNSPNLASSQYLVYSEFILYKSTNYYYINSSEVINMFYNLRVDFEKLQVAFELTKLIYSVTDENQDTSQILKLFLNTLYVIDKLNKDEKVVTAVFKIKLFDILGFAPRLDICNHCRKKLYENTEEKVFYDYINNTFFCRECVLNSQKKQCIEISVPTLIAINYVVRADIKKVFSFELKEKYDFELFGQVFTESISNSI